MNRYLQRPTTNQLVTILVVLALATTLPFAATAYADDGDDGDGAVDDEIEPGQYLAGSVAVQDAEFGGDLEERTFGVQIAMAETENAQAAIVAERLADVEQRLEAAEQRLDDAAQARENGEITEGEYRATVAQAAVEASTLERLAGQSEGVSAEFSEDVLAEHGIDHGAIEELRLNASELGGPAVAEIAQSIAGPDVGQSISGVIPGESPIDRDTLPGQSEEPPANETDQSDTDAPGDRDR